MSPSTNSFPFFDERFGDSYEIFLDETGNFLSATRYTGRLGQDPIIYDDFDHLPRAHRNAIESLICQRLIKKA